MPPRQDIRSDRAANPRLVEHATMRFEQGESRRQAVQEYWRRLPASESLQRNRFMVVLHKGSDEESVHRAVAALRKEKPGLDFELVPEPEGNLEVPPSTSAVVFVANGSNKGPHMLREKLSSIIDKHMIATVLVSEHEDGKGDYDGHMSFEQAINGIRLPLALRCAVYAKRSEDINGAVVPL